MRFLGGLHEVYAHFARERLAKGLPAVGGAGRAAGAFAPVPLDEAALRVGGNLDEAAALVALQEAAVPADFPNALGNTLWRELISQYATAAEPWRAYARIGQNNDFRPKFEILASEFEDLLPVPAGSEYKDSLQTDASYTIQLSVYGRLFSLSRETIINDDLGFLTDTPGRMARAVARTLNKFVVRSTLEANPNTYDGVTLFNASHNNLMSGGGSALSSSSFQTALQLLKNNTGDPNLNPSGGPMGITPKYLVVPSLLMGPATQLINSTIIVVASGTNTTQPNVQYGNINPFQGAAEVIVDPWLVSQTGWYLCADSSQFPFLQVNFLRGHANPDLLMERPYMSDVMGGGADPYEILIDSVAYKTRHQWGASPGLWWGAVKSAGS